MDPADQCKPLHGSLGTIDEDRLELPALARTLPTAEWAGGSFRARFYPPATASSRAQSFRSASAPRLLTSSEGSRAGGRESAHGSARASQRSRCSQISVASMRSRIEEAVQQEVKTALGDYLGLKADTAVRTRAKLLAMPLHLRPSPNPVSMGEPPSMITQQQRSLRVPVMMAVDPFWSTDLKKMNDRIGMRIEYERRLSAACTGSMAPELPHMFPKRYLSNPPTPYFVPGMRPH
ncbi:unnamed protein product [Polarella glacialis]|uniref:Uncharacterized protein n=1 Tax=Polarella glacialis TaxID=89957 RepID=A0A813JZG2_POLGL|nr:unnamed protein product [Polarella glacialis]